MTSRKQALLLLIYLSVSGAGGTERESIEVLRNGDRYILRANTFVAAPVEAVERVILDYENWKTLNPYLKKSQIIAVEDSRHKTVHLVTEACFLFVCYEVTHVQAFSHEQAGVLEARIIPEMSDFRSGWLRWKLREVNTGTQVSLQSEFVPDFFVPPLIGPYLIRKEMGRMAKAVSKNLELIATQKDGVCCNKASPSK